LGSPFAELKGEGLVKKRELLLLLGFGFALYKAVGYPEGKSRFGKFDTPFDVK